MTAPTTAERDVGRLTRSRFGGETHVDRYGDDDRQDSMFLVSAPDCPVAGVTSYGTVGLSNRPQFSATDPVHVELVAASASGTAHFDNLVASCVFESRKNGTNIAYGTSIKNILVQYGLSKTLKHVTFVTPFLWGNFTAETIDGKTVHWLMMLPISDSEIAYLDANGIDALEDRFAEAQIDVYDIERTPAV